MRTSDRGISLIAEHEGWVPTIYKDAAGYPTIGYGHLLLPGEEIKFRNGITKEQGRELLRQDIKVAEDAVNKYVNASMTQNQFDALVSFTYNVGGGNFQNSTLRKRVNEGRITDAANEFLRWIRAGGKVLLGLQRRRAKERKMFLGG